MPANKEEVLQLLAHMAHARARLEQTMMSGSKELGYKTSNWVSYHAGREQEELTNLTGTSCQAFVDYFDFKSKILFFTKDFHSYKHPMEI